MMKLPVYIVAEAAQWEPRGYTLRITSYDANSVGERGVIGVWRLPDIEFDPPADWNHVAAQVAELEAKKIAALADYQRTVAEINERLSKLRAITCEVTA